MLNQWLTLFKRFSQTEQIHRKSNKYVRKSYRVVCRVFFGLKNKYHNKYKTSNCAAFVFVRPSSMDLRVLYQVQIIIILWLLYTDGLRRFVFTSNNKGLYISTGARRDDSSHTASQPTVPLKEYVDIWHVTFQKHKHVQWQCPVLKFNNNSKHNKQ